MAAMMKRMQACDAKSIITFNNHPSGDLAPSREDIHLIRRLQEAGRIMCIELLDRVITGEGNYVSLKEKGIIRGINRKVYRRFQRQTVRYWPV